MCFIKMFHLLADLENIIYFLIIPENVITIGIIEDLFPWSKFKLCIVQNPSNVFWSFSQILS